MSVSVEQRGPVTVVTIDRPEVRNAVNPATAEGLREAFASFAADETASVAVLTGAGGGFCAGFDLKEVAAQPQPIDVSEDAEGPMGPTRTLLDKPVLAAVEGHAVAGGLELALWCDLRIAARSATFGVFNRRFGVPLIDGGTVRLPRLIGQGRALEMILTGRPVSAPEALTWGLVDRVVEDGAALDAAVELGREIATFPQATMRADRASVHEQWAFDLREALRNELRHGIAALESGEAQAGATRFSEGSGRHGGFE